MVKRNIGLVYGGAKVGIMGAIADEVLGCGGEVTGVIPKSLADKNVSHDGITNLKIVESMHERKSMMAEMSDGFIALPGGIGTLEEIFEVLTWAQLGFHKKPCALLNVTGYYNSLSDFLDLAVGEKFIKGAHRDMLLTDENPKKLLDTMAQYQAPVIDKLIN